MKGLSQSDLNRRSASWTWESTATPPPQPTVFASGEPARWEHELALEDGR